MTRLPIVLILAGLTLAGFATGAGAADQPSTTFVARPAEGSSTEAGGGWFLFPAAVPGTRIQGALALRNDGPGPLDLALAAVDADTAQRGGVAYGLADEPAEAVGRWISLSRQAVTLAPGSSIEVPFTVSVPADAAPGDHLGGIAAWAPDDGSSTPVKSGFAPGVVVRTRQVIAVQLAVPGPAAHALRIAAVRAVARPDGPYIEVVVDNVGRRLSKATGSLHVDGVAVADGFALDTIVPGTSVAYPVRWPGGDVGRAHEVEVALRYEGDVAAWTGELAVADAVRDSLRDWAAPAAPSAGVPLLPWMAGIGALGLLLGLVLAIVKPWRVPVQP